MRSHLCRRVVLVGLASFVGAVGCQGARRELAVALPASSASASQSAANAEDVPPPPPPPLADEPGKPGTTFVRVAAQTNEERALRTKLSNLATYSEQQLLADHAIPSVAPRAAGGKTAGLDKILKSKLAPSAAELALLRKHGFVVRAQAQPSTFTHAYTQIYGEHLPLYISADSILHVIHRSFDAGLATVESEILFRELGALLASLRARLGNEAVHLPEEVRRDLDLYLTVAASFLEGKVLPPAANAAPDRIADTFQRGVRAEGPAAFTLFGARWAADYSQLKPRGHYAAWGSDDPPISRYFRAMMWLGRTDFRLVETDGDKQVFRREALAGALAFLELMTAEDRLRYARIDDTLTAFVGEHDALHVGQLEALRSAVGVTRVAELAGKPDEELIRAVVDGHFGAQRIASQIQAGRDDRPAPLPLAFALFGQRYTVDSHVLSSVTYDRVPSRRMMPSSLDVAYAALGNDHAATLLAPELAAHHYAPQLERMRVLVDSHDRAFWDASLGTSWLSALRALSPSASELTGPKAAGLPSVFRTEAWGRRLASTQLASWAELRHDTILYAKQSLTGSIMCDFPDAYVEPYPELWARLGGYARKGIRTVEALAVVDPNAAGLAALKAHFKRLEDVVGKLEGMAKAQRAGKAFTAEQMKFVNDAVVIKSVGCGSQEAEGWYPSLFLWPSSALKIDPTIADVHTQPTDESGEAVGRVLHVGTGYPRFMTVTVDTCQGPRAYVGVVASFHEQITDHYKRLRDPEWSAQIRATPPADPPWLADVVAR